MNAKLPQPPQLPLTHAHLATVHSGLERVTTSGTGSRANQFGVNIAGKTGTAQNSHGHDHALFAGYAPANNPAYAAVAVIENGLHGSSVAAPIVGQLLAYLLSH